jgi:hypothetical protein
MSSRGMTTVALRLIPTLGLILCVTPPWPWMAVAQERPHGGHESVTCQTASTANQESGFDGIQLETSDIALYEEFFQILQARLVQHIDHPQIDKIRGYCYGGVEIVVRQDLAKSRPTGWVQVNFAVQDVTALKEELEKSYAASPVSKREELERVKVIRFRVKPDVMRSNRKAIRLEVYGPEGFMIGFNQYRE